MPNADFFRPFGLLLVQGFLDATSCLKLLEEMRGAQRSPATVADRPQAYVDQDTRRVCSVKVSRETQTLFGARLTELRPQVEQHFGIEIGGAETPQFLAYHPGDFFRVHPDTIDNPETADFVRRRKVSVVVFLNSQAAEPAPGRYSGGALTFYGLMNDPRMSDYGFPLAGEAGLLVAFRAAMLHEVRPVVCGERYTVVSWYY